MLHADLIAENVQLVALSEGALAERLESLHNEVEELREANAQLQKRDLERGVVLEQSVPLTDLLCAKAEADGGASRGSEPGALICRGTRAADICCFVSRSDSARRFVSRSRTCSGSRERADILTDPQGHGRRLGQAMEVDP